MLKTKLLLFALSTLLSLENVYSQAYGVYGNDHIIVDLENNIWDLDSILNSGTPVILHAFAAWSEPSWSYHNSGELQNLYNSSGWGGTENVAIFGLEVDFSTTESSIWGTGGNSQGDYTLGGTNNFPLSNNDLANYYFNTISMPHLLLICPDRAVSEIGGVTESEMISIINNCNGLSTSTNDPRIISHTTSTLVDICGVDDSSATDVTIIVQNYSNVSINNTYTFEAIMGGNVLASVNETLDLEPYEYNQINIGSVNLPEGTHEITAAIASTNDDLTNDSLEITILGQQIPHLGTGDLILNLTFDDYPSETAYGLAFGEVEQLNAITANSMFSAGTYPGQIDYLPLGSWADSEISYEQSYLSLSQGCYHLYMFDMLGDGMTYGNTGAISLSSPNSSLSESFSTNFGDATAYPFYITTDGSGGFTKVEEVQSIEFAKLFPNPTSESTSIQLKLTKAADVRIEITNSLGQIMLTNNLGEVDGLQDIKVSTSGLTSGIYLVNICVDENVLSKRLSIIK